VISAGGMCTGGRVLHHLIQNIERKELHLAVCGLSGRRDIRKKAT